jgi:hypothetical protein
MRCLSAVVVAATVVVVAAPTPARAADPKAEAKKLIAQGDALFKKGDYEGALAAYQKAYETFQSPKIFFPMAQAEEKLGRDLEAIAHYEQLLKDGGDTLPATVKTEAQQHIADIEKRIAVVTFDVDPAGATISVDDVELGAAPLATPPRLMPGKHKVAFAAQGRKPKSMDVTLAAGDRPVLTVKLDPLAPVVAKVKTPPKAQPVDEPSGSGRGVLYTSLFLTGAGVVGGTITGIMAIQKHSIYADMSKSAAQRAAAQSSGKTLAFTTDLLVFGAAAAGVFAVVWYYNVVKPRAAHHRVHNDEKKPEPTKSPDIAAPPPPGGDDDDAMLDDHVIVVPWASADAGGVAVMGRF